MEKEKRAHYLLEREKKNRKVSRYRSWRDDEAVVCIIRDINKTKMNRIESNQIQ